MKLKIAVTTALVILGSIHSLNANETTRLDTVNVVEQSETKLALIEAKKTQAKNITEILTQEASIDVAGGGVNSKRIYMRGLGDSFVNVTVDGARQGGKDAFNHRSGTVSLDTDILKSVKINSGVATADNGPGNLGGSIAFETVDAQDLLNQGKNYGAFIKTTLGSIDDSYKNSLALYGKVHENIGILLYGNKSDSSNYKTGKGREVFASAEEVNNYLAKISIIDLNSHSLKLSHERNNQEGLYFWRAGDHGFLDPSAIINPLVPQKMERKSTILNYGFNPNSTVNLGLKLYQNDEILDRLDNNTKYKTKRKGADLRNTFTFENDILRNKLTVGIDYEKNEGKEISGLSSGDENKGVFIQNRMMFDNVNLSFGARYDNYEQNIERRTFKGDKVSPNINAEYFLTQNISLFGGYGQAVNATNSVSVGFLSSTRPYTFNGLANGNLKAQESEKYELGINFDFNSVFTNNDNTNLKLTFFDTTIKNPISRNGGGMASRVDLLNYPDIEAQGIEAKVGYKIDNFKASLGYAHTKVKQNGIELAGTNKKIAANYGDKIVANLNYNVSSNLGFGYQMLAQLRNNNPANQNANNKAGYAIHNISTTYTPQELKNLTVDLSINNLFNKDYFSQTSLINSSGEAIGERGRDIRVSLKYKF